MTVEKFKKEFKVGDEITAPSWSLESYDVITAIGDFSFLATDNEGNENYYNIRGYNWIKPRKQVEQDLADCFEVVWFQKSDKRIICRLCYVTQEQFDRGQYITIEEAKARGLKINRQ